MREIILSCRFLVSVLNLFMILVTGLWVTGLWVTGYGLWVMGYGVTVG